MIAKSISGAIPPITRALFILVLGYTATSKILAPDIFISALQHSPLLAPYRFTLAWLLPLTELVVVFLLLLPSYKMPALSLATGLIGCFTIYIFYHFLRRQPLPCSCGGVISQLSWTGHAILNSTLLVLGLWSLYQLKYYRDKQEKPNT